MFFSRILFLLLFIPLIAYLIWYFVQGRKVKPSMKLSTISPFGKNCRSYKNYLIHAPILLRTVAISMAILVLARPVSTDSQTEKNVEGIDIMLAMDISTSMLAMDLKPNRIEAAKNVASDFVNMRQNDNVGITVFAGESFTQCPLTIDHATTLNLLNSISCDLALEGVIDDGTAIGTGLANSISRLKDSKAKSKVVILLTDGVNNMGQITPLAAADIAKKFNVRIYTIGVGTNAATAPFPINGYQINVPVEIDEVTLREIAEITGGKYYRATDEKSLAEIYKEIDELERTKLHVREYKNYEEEFEPFAFVALAALLLEFILSSTILRRIP